MALNKTTAELKVVETALPEKVAQKAGQVILSDDGKFFYDNTVKGRTRINPDGLKLIDTSSVSSNSIVTPLTSLCCTSFQILRLETSYNEDGWLGTITPESICLDSRYYCYIPKTGKIQDKFWEMLESDNIFIQPTLTSTVNGVYYAGFSVQLIYNGDGTASAAKTLSGILLRYPAPADSSDTYFNLALRVIDYDDSASNAQAIFESSYAFNTLRVRLRLLNTNGAYVTWTGTNIQAIHGSQESADSPITFAAPIQIRNPQTGEIESIQTQEGGYIKFLGFDTVRNAIDRFDEGEEGIIQVTNSEDVNLIYASFPFEPTWVNGNDMSSTGITTALPLPYKVLKNASSVYFFRGSPNADDFAYGHISSIINDCGSFCIVHIVIDNTDDLSISLDDVTAETSGITHIDVEYTVSAVSGEAVWYHTNEYGVKFIEVIVPPVILDEVDEESDQPVRSSAIAKYVKHNVTGLYKFRRAAKVSGDLVYNSYDLCDVVNWAGAKTTHEYLVEADSTGVAKISTYYWAVEFENSQSFMKIGDILYIEGTAESGGEIVTEERVITSVQDGYVCISEDITVTIVNRIYTIATIELNPGDNIVWIGNCWDKLAGTIDLSSYATKSEVQAVKSDLTRVLRYCGSIYCNKNEAAVTTGSLRIGDVYNVYFYSDDGWGTIKLNNSDTEVVISDDGTATFVGTSIETRNGGRSETANYLRMDIAAIKSQTSTEYHWIIVPTSDSFSSYTIPEYSSGQLPAAGTYQVTEVSIYVDKKDNGINVVWDGIGFDRLSPAIDMSTYLSKSEIGSVVSSTETMPVSGKAVDAAIKSAVSSVYRFRNSTTVDDFETTCRNSVTGDVFNLLQSGTITFYEPEQVPLNCTKSVSGGALQAYFNHLYDWITVYNILDVSIDGDSGFKVDKVYKGTGSYTMVSIQPKDGYEFIDGKNYSITATITIPQLAVEEGDNIVKAEVGWDKLSSSVDLSPYATVEDLWGVKADIAHAYRYKGHLSQLAYSTIPSDLHVGDVYVEDGNWSGPLELHNLTGTIADSGSSVEIPALTTYSYTYIPNDPRVIVELTYVGTDGELGTAIVDRCVSRKLILSSADSNWPDTEGTQVEIDTYAVKFVSVANGDNLAWNGWTFDVLGSYVDLSPYQLKSGVTSKVASGNTDPVQSGAVYDAIQAAVSSVYKPIGSYTVELLNRYRTDYQEFTNIFAEGNVVNIANDGLLLQPNVSETVSALGLQLISVEANSDNPALFDYVFETSSNDYYAIFKAYAQRVYCDGIAVDAFEVNSDYDLVVTGDLSSIAKDVGDAFSVTWSLTDIEVLKGDNVVWTPAGWDKLAGTVDLTGYQPKLEFAAEISSENASKAVTAGPVKSYVDSEISKFLESSGSILNLVGSGQATVLAEYTWSEDTTYAAEEKICTLQFSSPAYKIFIPEPDGINGSSWRYNIYSSSGGSFTQYGNNYRSNDAFLIEVLSEDTILKNFVSHDDGYTANNIYTMSEFGSDIDHITLTNSQAITIYAGTNIKIYGWPIVQESDTATSLNKMLKEIYDTQEAFKAQTSIPDSDSGVKTYTSLDNLPAAANSGAVAAVTSDSNTSARGMYMFINGSWQRLAFAGESLVDGDTVEVSIE